MTGYVVWFNEFKGYGEIESQEGDRFFLTYHDIYSRDKVKLLKEGWRVRFEVGSEYLFGWPRAEKIKIITKKIQKDIHRKRKEFEL